MLRILQKIHLADNPNVIWKPFERWNVFVAGLILGGGSESRWK